ncbi:hypothetical protein EMMF5_004957 [Cystobasidiomycetes sp. EMM_F5]
MELQPSDVAIGDDKLAATGAIQNTQDVLTVTTTAGLAQTPDAENHSSNSDAAPPGFPSRLKAFSKKQNRQFAAICWSAGLNYIQVSTLFIGAFSGFVLAAFVNNAVTDRLGMGKTAQSSAWLAALPRSGANLNYGQASYVRAIAIDEFSQKADLSFASQGLGALLSPLAATSLASSGVKFSYFFGVSLGLATLNSISLFFAFGRDSDHRPQQRKRDPRPQDNPGVGNIEMQPPDVENVTAITRREARVGDRKCLYGYIVLSLLLELSVWFWRQLIGNAVAICLIGYFLSTFFGIGIMAMTRSLPKPLHTGAIGLVAAAGQAGSAAFPFLTGALAQKYGPVVLQPVIIALLVGMGLVFHFGMPEGDRRAE